MLLCIEDWAGIIYGACGCGGPVSICLTEHRLAHQLGSSLLLQEDPVVDLPMLVDRPAIQLCFLATQGIHYSQICGRIIGYQVGEPQSFISSEGHTIQVMNDILME